MKTIEEATIEDLIRDLTHWEDPDMTLMINQARDGGFWVSDYNGYGMIEAGTLRDALIKYGKNSWRTSDALYEGEDGDEMNVDWRT